MRITITTSLVVFALWSSCGSIESREERAEAQVVTSADDQTVNLVRELASRRLTDVGTWDIGEEAPLTYLVRDGASEGQLQIVDQAGKILYKKEGVMVSRVYSMASLRKEISQLVFHYSEGGTDSYVQMLDIHKNQVIERIDPSSGQNSFAADARIQPQFRSGVDPAKEPFEIVLMEFGIASPAGGKAKILRYDGNKYRLIGTFDRREAEDCKERLIKP